MTRGVGAKVGVVKPSGCDALLTSYPGVGLLAPVPGALVMAAWTLAILAILATSCAVFLRRDA